MTVYAIVNELNAGYAGDKDQVAEAGLQLGDKFTLMRVSMGQSSSTVYLEEFDRGFNSVFFRFEENGKPLNIYADHRFNPYL